MYFAILSMFYIIYFFEYFDTLMDVDPYLFMR